MPPFFPAKADEKEGFSRRGEMIGDDLAGICKKGARFG